MIKSTIIFSALLLLNTAAISSEHSNSCETMNVEENNLRAELFSETHNPQLDDIDWSTIELIEIEEEVELGFNPKDYLPEGFNPLKGKHNLDLSTIEVIEIEEEVELGFDTKDYLPGDFNAYKGMCKYSKSI